MKLLAGLLFPIALMSTTAMAFTDLGIEREWDGRNSPSLFSDRFESNLDKMPLSGRLSEADIPWSDSYWPNVRGGISFRWNATQSMDFKYEPPTREQALRMTPEQLAGLSPAEKYDLYVGNYSYPTVKAVRRYTSPSQPGWYGICHGWSPASLNYREPAPVTVTNPDGVAIPFGSSDVKALISYYYSINGLRHSVQLGRRCGGFSKAFGTAACKDVNAGAFHVVLANQVGIAKKGFIADLSGGEQVWNFPIFAYASTVVAVDSSPRDAEDGVVKRIHLRTTVEFGSETAASWIPNKGTDAFKQGSRVYEYWLDLDQAGNILGGEWISSEFPDFLWKVDVIPFEGYFSKITDLYRRSAETPKPEINR